ncbi:MAG: hypothetical protein QFX35_02325 [Candidatus Verstraetearchaeota archaeon]|nr:hypothetical protein [Candidatus Verstraetearchaeota archaeon]
MGPIEDFRNTISSLKRGRTAKVCPECGSIDISPLTMTGYITQPSYVCNKCGYQSTIFPELDLKDVKEFRQTLGGKGESEAPTEKEGDKNYMEEVSGYEEEREGE